MREGLLGPLAARWGFVPRGRWSTSITGKVIDVEPIASMNSKRWWPMLWRQSLKKLRAGIEDLAIMIDSETPSGSLYGLYEGVPLTSRSSYAHASPDRDRASRRHDLSFRQLDRGRGPPSEDDVAPRGRTPSASMKSVCKNSAGPDTGSPCD